MPLGVEIELRFALRSTVAEIMAIEVSANWPLSKTLKYASLERKHGIHTIYMHFVPFDLGNAFRPLSQTSWSGFGDIELDISKTPKKAI